VAFAIPSWGFECVIKSIWSWCLSREPEQIEAFVQETARLQRNTFLEEPPIEMIWEQVLFEKYILGFALVKQEKGATHWNDQEWKVWNCSAFTYGSMHAKSTPSLASPGSKQSMWANRIQILHGLDQSYLCTFSLIKLFVCWLCLFLKFQKLFSFTWSSFHVYGSLLSNQIEASKAHKKWIVWHLRVWKVTFACKTSIDVSSLRFVLRWDVARNATSLMMSHKPG